MRVAAAAVGGAGAALGAVVYLLAAALWVAIVALSGMPPTSLVDLAVVGTAAAGVLLCGAGGRGAWLALRGRARPGALLMLLSAAGILAVFAAQPLLVGAAGAYGVPERLRVDTGTPPGGYYRATLAPAVLLLLGAALAFLAHGRGARTNAGSG
jgi:hypothetical protein